MDKRTIAFFANSSHKLLPGCCMGKPLFRSLQPLLQVLQRCPTELLQVCSVRQRFPRYHRRWEPPLINSCPLPGFGAGIYVQPSPGR